MTAVRLARGATGRAEDREVRRLLPRPPDALLVAGRQRRRDARAARIGRRHRRARSPTRSSCRTTTSPRSTRARRARRRRRGDHRRAGRRQHGPRRRRPTASSTALRERCTRHGALLVFDEVITGFRVGLGGAQARFGVTPDLSMLRQGHRRRPARSPRSAAAPTSWTSSRRSAPCTRRARCRGTRSRPRPGSPCSPSSTTARTTALERTAERLADGLRKAFADAGVAAQVTRAFTLVGVFFADAPVRDYDDARARRPRALRAALPRPARPRRVLRAERLRDAVPEPGPHRRRHRRHDRRGRRRRARDRVALSLLVAALRACGAPGPCRRASPRTGTP